MWGIDGATARSRAPRVAMAAVWLAGAALAAQAAPPTVTDADIERARQHRMPTDAELARVPVPAGPRIENLPQPVTKVPVDLEAVSRGFDLQAGVPGLKAPGGKAGPKLLIFVSLAMPDATLQRLLDQASAVGATLVLRGLVDGSIRATVTRMQALIGNRRVAVQIDPQAFDRYAVARTPTFVLVNDGAAAEGCTASACDTTERFTKVSGDVTLEYAMRYLTGDAGRGRAGSAGTASASQVR